MISLNSVQQIEEWFVSYSDDVYRFLVHLTGSLDVEDLVQETFIRAMKGMNGYRAESNPKTWLFKIARNLSIDGIRKKKTVYAFQENLSFLSSSEKGPDELVEISEMTRSILLLSGNIHPKYRDVLISRGVHDLSVADTARILGWTKGKVNVTYHRAIKAAHHLLTEPTERGLST